MKARRHTGRAIVILGVTTAALAMVATAAASTIRATPAFEWLPAHGVGTGPAGNQYLAWTQRPKRGSPATSNNVMASVNGGPAFKVNATGSGFTGGISGNTLVYARVTSGQSNLAFYNLLTRAATTAPPEVNTSAWEYHPSMVGQLNSGWLLFGRKGGGSNRIILLSLANHHSTVLASGGVDPGQVNGPDASGLFYASWMKCAITCDVHVYRFDPASFTTGTTRSVGLEQNRTRSGPSVAADGTLYFVEGAAACGVNAEIGKVADPFGTPVKSTLVDFRSGFDSFHTYVDGGQVFFDRHRCGGDSNLFAIAR